jgi:glycosyltransferase involved in cell wall biosynthesis
MRRRPIVSIIIPTYNGSLFLSECIESILKQTYSDFELILIDDGSSDNSYSIASGYAAIDDRVVLLSHDRNLGIVNALNRGLQVASGRLIARLGHDDVALSHRLKEQVAFLENHSDVVLLGSLVTLISSDGKTIGGIWVPETDCQIRFGLLFDSKIADPSAIYRADIVAKYGLHYDPSCECAEDYKFCVELLKYGRAYSIQEPLVKYRLHDDQMSRKFALRQEQVAQRISAELLYELDPALRVSSLERKVLDGLYRFYFRSYSSGQWANPDRSFQYFLRSTRFSENGVQRIVERLIIDRTLQEMAGKFIARYGTEDTALRHLVLLR